jgi:hypothetical protein
MTTKKYADQEEQRFATRFERKNPVGTKASKRISKHNLDHSNPGGVVSEFFRQKNAKI